LEAFVSNVIFVDQLETVVVVSHNQYVIVGDVHAATKSAFIVMRLIVITFVAILVSAFDVMHCRVHLVVVPL
jgi:hypothetical protein